MTKPMLAIDFGASASSAVLVSEGRQHPIKDPVTGSYSWPSSVFQEESELLAGAAAEQRKRTAPDSYRAGFKAILGRADPVTLGGVPFKVGSLVAAVLRRLREEAEAVAGAPIDRTVLTIPSSYGEFDPQWAEMIDAGREAGFTYIDLLPEPVAAGLAPLVGGPFRAGDTVLVYDLGGGTFDAALVRFAEEDGYEVLGHAAEVNTGGREIDARLVAYVREHADPELVTALSPPVGKGVAAKLAALRASLIIEDLVRELKHHLSEREAAEQYLSPLMPPITLTRTELDQRIKPLLDDTLGCCHRLLSAADLAMGDLAGILQVGGSTRLPAVKQVLSTLGPPLRRPVDLDLAVVEGAANWATRASSRRLQPSSIEPGHRPLRWRLPIGQAAELERWLVQVGEIYTADLPLALVRLRDGSLWRLYDDAAEPRQLHHVQSLQGDRLVSGDWLATVCVPAPRLILAHDGEVDAMAFDGSGSRLAATSHGRLSQWDVTTGQEVESPTRDGKTKVVTAEGRLLAATTSGEELLLWNVMADEDVCSLEFTGTVNLSAADPGLSRLAIVPNARNQPVEIWRTAGERNQEPLVLTHAYQFARGSSATQPFASDVLVSGFVVGLFGGQSTLYRKARADRMARMLLDPARGNELLPVSHSNYVRAAKFSPEGSRFATGGDDKTARVWDAGSGKELLSLVHEGSVSSVTFSPDGTQLATGSGEKLRIWDLAGGRELVTLTSQAIIKMTVYSPDGGYIAVATSNGAVELWAARLARVAW
jgi:actin-like ATPase involved in cell morphogenesis